MQYISEAANVCVYVCVVMRMNVFLQQELQQREHEEELRERFKRSESIEKAAVSHPGSSSLFFFHFGLTNT